MTRRRLRGAVLAAGWWAALVASAAAQDPAPAEGGDAGLTDVDRQLLGSDMVELAARRPQERRRSSAATSVITAEEIRTSGAQTLAEVMRYAAGLTVMRSSRGDSVVNIRGLNTPGNPELMLLIDGRPAPMEFFGITLWDHLPVPLESIDRIEIVRGPASPLYGANAFSGIINIRTKPPAEKPQATAEVSAGSQNAMRATGRLSGRQGPWGITATVSYRQADGFSNRLPQAFLSAADPILLTPALRRPGLENLCARAAVHWTGIEHLELIAGGGWIRSADIDLLTSLNTWVAHDADDGYGRLQARFDHPTYGNFQLDAWLRRTHLPAEALFPTPAPATPPFPVDQTIINDVFEVQAQRVVKPFDGNVLTYGGAWRVSWLNGRDVFGDAEKVTIGSLFIQDEYHLCETLDATLSLRWDVHTTSGDNVSPRGSIVWTPSEAHTFRLLGGQAYRNPTHVQNFAALSYPSGLGPGLNISILGNRDLEAERQSTVQFDYATTAIAGVRIECSAYYEYLQDLILFVQPSPVSPPPANYVNSGHTDAAGGEAGIEGTLTDWLRGFVNYSFMWADGEFEGVSPKHQGNVGLRATVHENIHAAITLHAQSESRYVGPATVPTRRVKGYLLLRVRLAYRYQRGELAVTAFGPFENGHQEFPRGAEIPWQAGVTLSYSF